MRVSLFVAAFALLTTQALAQFDPNYPPVSAGPFGGSASSVVVSPTNSNVVLVLKNWGELFRSTDAGVTFDKFGVGVPADYNDDLTVDPSNPNTVYMLSGMKVLKSTDFGANWTTLPLTVVDPGNFDLKSIAISSTGNEILVTGPFSVYRSTDAGLTWNVVASLVPYAGDFFEDVAFAPSNPSIAFCTALQGLYKSTDGGATFIKLTSFTSWILNITVSPTNADIVFIGTPFASKVMRSMDGGLTFQPVHNGLQTSASSQFFHWTADGLTLWFGHLKGIVKTSDLGNNWDDANSGIPTQNTPLPNALGLDTQGNAYLGANGGDINDQAGGGLYKRLAGNNPWVHVGFLEVLIRDVAITEPGGKRLVGIGGGVYAGDLGSEVLPTVLHYDFGTDTRTLAVDPNDPHRWVAGGVGSFLDNAQIFLLTQDGTQAVKTYERSGVGYTADLVFDPHNPGRVIAGMFPGGFGTQSILVSNDSGASWNEIAGTEGWATRSVAFDPFVPGRVFQLSITNQWSSSANGGLTWLPLQTAWPGIGFGVFLAFDPFIPNVLYRGETGNGLWRSDDGGVNWIPLGLRLHEQSGLALNLDVPGMLFVSDSLGKIRMSTDRGNTFKEVWSVHLQTNGTSMALDRANGNLIVGTTAASLWELPKASPVYSYGTGTPGCQGTQSLTVNEAPLVNTPNLTLTSHKSPPNSLGLGLVTDAPDLTGSDPFAIGVKLHVDLFLATEVLTFDFVSDALGMATVSTPVPNSPVLANKTYYATTLWAWTTCALPPFGLSTSRGLALTIRL